METLRNKPFNYLQHIAVTTLLVFGAMVISMRTCDLGIGKCVQVVSARRELSYACLVLELTGGISATALAFLVCPNDLVYPSDIDENLVTVSGRLLLQIAFRAVVSEGEDLCGSMYLLRNDSHVTKSITGVEKVVQW
jgi:hypothetical protein